MEQYDRYKRACAEANKNANGTPKSSAAVGNTQQERKSENESSSESKAPMAAISASALPINTSATLYPPVPVMQPGATMQAMASFQQAAAAAMQVAVQGMQGISPGASLTSLAQPAPTTGSASAQQAYNDTMTALAMQQAAIAAASVPPHLMAHIVGQNSNGWSNATASTAPTSVAPAAILPATTRTNTAQSTATTSAKAESTPVSVAPMPSKAVVTKGAGES